MQEHFLLHGVMVRLFLILLFALVGCGAETSLYPHAGNEQKRPNVLLLMADDLGFSDLGSFGGEIETPNLDALAGRGLRLTNFHTSVTCAPTRAMLLTGRDNHMVGLGAMAEFSADNQYGRPGYEGALDPTIPTLAERLRDVGYHTYMVGKWHLGTSYEASPHSRGFEQSFGPIYGGGSHFDDRIGPEKDRAELLYRENGDLIDVLPEDFYSTRSYTQRAIEQIASNLGDGEPFFAMVNYTAPHWPLQVPDDLLAAYSGAYDQGYEKTRQARMERIRDLNLLSSDPTRFEPPEYVESWESLTETERRGIARNMEIYAAMVSEMDAGVGRIFEYLEHEGELENTLVLFLSDNGAEAWSDQFGPPFWTPGRFSQEFDNSLENRGKVGSFVFYGPEWSHVSNAPFDLYKGFTGEGGSRVPAIISWDRYPNVHGVSKALTSVTDIYWTILEAAALPRESFHSNVGVSLMPLMRDEATDIRGSENYIGIEMWGRSALYKGDWKIRYLPDANGSGEWELFDLSEDPFEMNDLAADRPLVMQDMLASWEQYTEENNVIFPLTQLRPREPVIPER